MLAIGGPCRLRGLCPYDRSGMQNTGSIVRSPHVERLARYQVGTSLVSNRRGVIDPSDFSSARPQSKDGAADGNKRPGDFVRSPDSSVGSPCRCSFLECTADPEDVELLVARDVHFAICDDGNEICVCS